VVRKSRKKPEQLSKTPSSGQLCHIVGRYLSQHRLKAHSRGFQLHHSRLSSDNTLVSANIRHLAKNTFAQICGFALSRNRVFPRMSDHVSPRRVVVTNSGWCQIKENLESYQALKRWFAMMTLRAATTSQSKGVRRWEKKILSPKVIHKVPEKAELKSNTPSQ
jgi:hypothetical protein